MFGICPVGLFAPRAFPFPFQFIVKFGLSDCLPYFHENIKMKYGIRHHLTMINLEIASVLQVAIRAGKGYGLLNSNRIGDLIIFSHDILMGCFEQ